MKNVNASIITIGDELLIGQTIDTNSAWIATELNKIGVWIKRKISVGDVREDILNALDSESREADIILLTGGLGPTADDITKPLLCEYFQGKMVVNNEVLEFVKEIFTKLNRPILERNLKQAEVPDTCTVLFNKRGTAPGMLFRKEDKIFISLPGVPYEMKGLITDEVIPIIKKEFKLPAILHKTMFTAGQGESFIAEQIRDFENALPPDIRLAYMPSYGMVRLRLSTRADTPDQAEEKVAPYFNQLKLLLKEIMVSDADQGLAETLGILLKKKNKTMATAESCTGGYIAHLITSIPESSEYYNGSVISYSNDAKSDLLNVSSETLEKHGAVSEETVKEMVTGALRTLKVDYALAASGIMGPGGGSEEKPVGTVWIAAGSAKEIITSKLFFRFDRTRNIEMTAHAAMNLLRKVVLKDS